MLEQIIQGLENYRDNLVSYVRESLEASSQELLEEQREQLFEGKASDGANLRPLYSEDLKANGGYFKSPESARSYANYKATKVNYPSNANLKRDVDAPNLYINGQFHSQIVVEFTQETMTFTSSTPKGMEIMAKYGMDAFGLEETRMQRILDDRCTQPLIDKFTSIF